MNIIIIMIVIIVIIIIVISIVIASVIEPSEICEWGGRWRVTATARVGSPHGVAREVADARGRKRQKAKGAVPDSEFHSVEELVKHAVHDEDLRAYLSGGGAMQQLTPWSRPRIPRIRH